ncbi:hypothetical protein ACFL43_03750 [Thermodesulfobacteriota bacterium]
MKKTIIYAAIFSIISLFAASYAFSTTITVDGYPGSLWNNADVVRSPDNASDAPSGDANANILDNYITNDVDTLYVRFDVAGTIFGTGNRCVTLLDTDNNPSTGEAQYGIGADYRIRIEGSGGSAASWGVERYDGSGTWTWVADPIFGHAAGVIEIGASLASLGAPSGMLSIVAYVQETLFSAVDYNNDDFAGVPPILYWIGGEVADAEMTVDDVLVGGEKKAEIFNFTVTDGSGQPIINKHIVVQYLLNGVTYYILTPPTDAAGAAALQLPYIEAAPARVLRLFSAASTAVEVEVLDAQDPIGCCHQLMFCPGQPNACYESCFTVYDAEGTALCVVLNDLQNLDTSYAEDAECVEDEEGFHCEPITLIELDVLEALPLNGAVKIVWSTVAEIDNAGFNIYRAESADGEYVRINDSMISAEGFPTEGATYEFTDSGARNRQTYYYKLEDVDFNGTLTEYGPVDATPRVIYSIVK